MTDLLSLGQLYISDFLADGEEPRAAPADLSLVMDDDTNIVHLASQPDPDLMWGRYWYRSGTNQTMRSELEGIANEIIGIGFAQNPCLWVDIACNDGTLIGSLPQWVTSVGVDPVAGEIHDEAAMKADLIVQSPFNSVVAAAIHSAYGPAEVITCIAMFYDLPDPTDFLIGVRNLLARDGVFVLQLSYTPLMLKQLAFDNICHEHARYYTLRTLRATLRSAGFEVVDCQLNATNGGSMRVYAQRMDADPASFGTQPYRDVAAWRRNTVNNWENSCRLNEPNQWHQFAARLAELRAEVYDFIQKVTAQGMSVWGYGASMKGNTLLQYFGLDHSLIDAIAERQEAKWGLRTVGTDIPIVSEMAMRDARPDYLLMLPWHFVAEFTEREADYLAAGGKFIVPCPQFEIIGNPTEAIGDGRKPA